MGFLRKIPRFWRRKKEEVVEGKPEVVEKIEEFPGISASELREHVGKHVAIVAGKIVSSSGTARRVLAMAKRKHLREEITLRYVGSERLLLKCKCLEKGK